MKILHVIGSLDPAAGGPPMVAARLAAAQARLGCDVTILAYAKPQRQAPIDQALADIPHWKQCRLELLAPVGRLGRGAGLEARRALRSSLDRADVAHLHGVWERLLYLTAAAFARRRRAYVVRPCGMLDPWSLGQSRWKKRLALALGYRRMLDQALFIHALNADEAQLLEPLKLRCPVEVLPNGVFLEEIQPLPPTGTFRRRYPELEQRPVILFLSRLHYKKGLDYLADAFAIVARQESQPMLVVAGPDGGALADFEKRVDALGLRQRVKLVGPLYGQDKLAALADADCFCLPSRQEGFSVAITEALACGLPAVISQACHFPQVAQAGAGSVVPLDPAAIASALLAVLRDADLRQRMSHAGRRLIAQEYTWPAIAQRMIHAYESRLATRPGPLTRP